MERIHRYSINALVAAVLVMLVFSLSGLAQKPAKPKPSQPSAGVPAAEPDPNKGIKPPSGPSFYIAPIEGSRGMFSLLLSDGNLTVAGSFTQQQVDIFEAVLTAAKEFAETDEAIGKSAPVTTRLMDKTEWSLFADVSKVGDRSRIYVSLITPSGKLTADAGEIVRGSKKESSALLLKMLSQIQGAKIAAATPHL